MQWSQLYFERGEWRIPTTKNGEPQTVTLGAEAVEILRARVGCDPLWVFPGTGATGHLVEPKKGWKRVLGYVQGVIDDEEKPLPVTVEEHAAWCERLRKLVESQPMIKGDTVIKMRREARY